MNRIKRALLIMAKMPEPGKVKTRLAPLVSLSDAADLYRALLEDTIDLVGALPGVQGGIAHDPPSSGEWFRRAAPPGFMILPQPAGDLGLRLEGIFEELFRLGCATACLMNSDGPDLPPALLEQAFLILERGKAEVVFGPNDDGGYYLVGMSGPADIFRDIPWSTPAVLEKSLTRVRAAGLCPALLPPWPDLDTIEDLDRAVARWVSGEVTPPRRSFQVARRLRPLAGGTP
jgi:rSAM/selenodomain-associated transferase 1